MQNPSAVPTYLPLLCRGRPTRLCNKMLKMGCCVAVDPNLVSDLDLGTSILLVLYVIAPGET